MTFPNFIKSIFLGLLIGCFAQNSIAQCGTIELISNQYSACQPAQFKWVLKNVPPGSIVSWDYGNGKQDGNDTFLAFVDKAGKISVNVKIALTGGSICEFTKTDFVEVYPTPVPAIYVSRKKLCNGADSVSYFDITPNAVKRTWSVDGSYFYNTQPKFNYTYKTPGIKKVSLVIENNYGCIGIKEFDSATIIYPKPELDFTANILTGCVNKSVRFTPIINTYGVAVNSYIWTFPGGQPFKQLKDIPDLVSYSVAGIFSPSLEINTANGCNFIFTKPDYQSYGTPVSLSLKISDTAVCLGKTITIENLDKTLAGNFNWNINGTSTLSQPDKYTNIATYSAMGKYDVSVFYNHNGCSVSQSFQNIIRVKDVKAGFVSGDNLHCKLPHTIHFTNLSKSYEPGTMFYQWKIYENSTLVHFSNSVNDSFSITKAGLYDVSLIAMHTNGCQNTFSSKEFITNKKIAPEFDAIYKLGCINQTIQFIQKTPPSSYQASNKYKWTFFAKDNSKILGYSTSDDAQFSFPDSGFYTVKLIADNGVGCKDSIIKRNFIEIVKPAINFSLTENTICKNDVLYAVGNSSPAHVNFRYFWYLKNKTDGSEIYKESPTFNESLNKAGQYDFKFVHQINTGCRDSIVNNKLVNSNGINATMKLDTANGCLPFKVKPTLTITENLHFGNASNTLNYRWTANPSAGVTILNDTNMTPQFIFTKRGQYQIMAEIRNSVSCTQTIISQTISAGVSADFLISDSTVCLNQTILLKNNSGLKPTGIKWIINTNTITNDPLASNELNVRFTTGGIQKIGLVADKFNVCFDTVYKSIRSIVVKANLEAVQTVMKCAPVYAKFLSHSINADSLIWNFGDGNKITTSDSFVANIYKKNTGSDKGYTLILIAKSNEGCSDTMVKQNYMKIIGPVPEFSLQNFKGCTPVEVNFINNSKEVYKYYINYGDNTANDTITGKHIYTLKNIDAVFETYMPKMYASDIVGCVAVYESIDTIKIIANPKSIFTLSDTITCANNPIQITNKSLKITSSDFYIFNGIERILLSSDFVVQPDKGIYKLTQVVKNAGNCYDSSNAQIRVNPNPKADFELTDTLCLSKPVNFKNISTSEFPLITFDWEIKNPATPFYFITYNSKFTFNSSGLGSVKLTITDSNKCQNTMLKNFNVIDPVSIPSGELKMVSVNPDNSVNSVAKPNNYYRFLFNNFYFKNNLIHSSTLKAGIDFNTYLPANFDSVCIDITATDVCGYESKKGLKHCTIFLKIVSNKPFTNQLNWTPYVGWPVVSNYSVYRKKQTELSYSLIKTLDGNTISWLDSGLCNSEYSYYISAVYLDAASKSNIAKSTPQFIYPVSFSDIKNVSVVDNNSVKISWEPSSNRIFNNYSLYRTCVQSGKTDIIKLAKNIYLDKNVNTSQYTYMYQVTETDLCNNSSLVNQEGKTILLTGKSVEYKSLLNWNTYKTWASGVKNYTLQIEKDGVFKTLFISSNADSIFIHKQQLENIHGPYCYRIMAVSGNNKDTSFSNITCLVSPSTLFFPNAFSPNGDGVNDKISVRSLFVYNNTPNSGRNFSLEIFNRSGEMIFQSHNIDEEWNGMYQGNKVQTGVYMYHLKAVGADYRSYLINGTITVLP